MTKMEQKTGTASDTAAIQEIYSSPEKQPCLAQAAGGTLKGNSTLASWKFVLLTFHIGSSVLCFRGRRLVNCRACLKWISLTYVIHSM